MERLVRRLVGCLAPGHRLRFARQLFVSPCGFAPLEERVAAVSANDPVGANPL